MKRFLSAMTLILLVLALCGCENKAAWRGAPAPERPEVSAVHTIPPTPTPLPENAVRETFRPEKYVEPVTVTVTYDDEHQQCRVEIVRDGAVLQTFTEYDGEWYRPWKHITVEDMNFDGDLDFRFCYATFAGPNYWEHVYLYEYDFETGKASFRKAEELDGMCQLAFDQSAETVCNHSSGSGHVSDTLYKWTGEGCAARRRIDWAFDYQRQTTLFSVWDRAPGGPALPEWDEPEGYWTQLCQCEAPGYAEPGTDAELDRWYNVDYYGEPHEPPGEIPRDLLDFLTPLAADDTWRPFAAQYAAGRALSQEETDALWESASGYGVEKVNFFAWGTRLDGDNDGKEDIFLCDMQGSGHFNWFYFLKDGGEATEDGLLGNFTSDYFISWKGNRYLLAPWYGGDTGRFDGLNIWLFRDGKGIRRAYLERSVSDYRVESAWAEEGYEDVLKDLEGRAAALWADFDESWEQPLGTAERTETDGEETWYLCDLNNDGTEERYRKFTTSATSLGSRSLYMRFKDGDFLFQRVEPLRESGLQLCWSDARPQGNLLVTAACWGDMPIVFSVWLWEGETTSKVAELTLERTFGAKLAYYGDECSFD